MNFITSAAADISHLQSKYFTAKRFHLPFGANFIEHLLYAGALCIEHLALFKYDIFRFYIYATFILDGRGKMC